MKIEVAISINCHSAILSPEEELIEAMRDEMVREIDADIMRQLGALNA